MKKPPSRGQLQWWTSPEFRAVGHASALCKLARFAATPKCGARRRYDGQPCQNPGLGAGGRCRFHGGRTPAGDKWHQIQWPAAAANAEEKLAYKLAALQRKAKKRQQRIAAMTPSERAQYEAWLSAHKPSTAADRALRREEQRWTREFKEISDRAPRPESPEVQRIHALIAQLKNQLAQSEAERQALAAVNQGVFE